MIKLQDLTPEVYYKKSRDFQFIGRLYDIVLNSVKTNTDLLYSLPISDSSDKQLVDLMSLTLGFKQRHNYNQDQLVAVCSILPEILRKKGTLEAITLVGNAVLNADGQHEQISCIMSEEHNLLILIPNNYTDTTLLEDLLDYILPAGITYNLIVGNYAEDSLSTIYFYKDYINSLNTPAVELSIIPQANKTEDYDITQHPGLLSNTTVLKANNNNNDDTIEEVEENN